MQHRSCPVCDGSEAHPLLRKNDLQLVRCDSCSMVYANPVGSEFASGLYYDQIGSEFYLSPEKLQSDYAPVRFEREQKIFRRHCPRGRVLDVGCSSGAFLYQLRQRFGADYDILGTDVSGPPLDYAESQGIPIVRGNFLENQFDGRRFDCITFWAVLEHLLHPRLFLHHARDLLAPGGLCLVLVPNFQSLAVRILGARYRYIYPQHLNYFTPSSLSRLSSHDFQILALTTTHLNPVVIWQDWMHKGRDVSNQERAALLKQTTAYKQNPALAPLKFLYRCSERLLAAGRLADNLCIVLTKLS